MHSCSLEGGTCTRTCTRTQGQYNIQEGTSRGPSPDQRETEKQDRWRGRLPISPPIQLCETGGWAAFLPAWEEEVGNSILGTDLDGRGQRKERSAAPSLQGQEPAECGFSLKEQGGEDFSRMNRLMSPGVSPANSFPWGGKLLQGKDVGGGLGHRAKCLSVRCPRTLVGAD